MEGDVKVTLKPSEEIVKLANAEVTVTDARGRVLTLKKPGVLAQLRLVKALGDTAANDTYRLMVLPVLYVSMIDGDVVPPPSSELEVEALFQQLDDDGLRAIGEAVKKHFGAANPKSEEAELKK